MTFISVLGIYLSHWSLPNFEDVSGFSLVYPDKALFFLGPEYRPCSLSQCCIDVTPRRPQAISATWHPIKKVIEQSERKSTYRCVKMGGGVCVVVGIWGELEVGVLQNTWEIFLRVEQELPPQGYLMTSTGVGGVLTVPFWIRTLTKVKF